jgi:TamB, inner membrane protein subunit of TAM complex
VALLVGGAGTFLFLTRTATGQTLVLRQILRRLDGVVNGEIQVARITSPRLLREATLHGVRISTPDGRPVFQVDSLKAEYSVRDLLAGEYVFAGVELWRPVVTITKAAGAAAYDVSVVLGLTGDSRARPEAEGGSAVRRARLILDNVVLHDGRVEVAYPISGGASDRALTRADPTGAGLQRTLSFNRIDGVLPRLAIIDPEIEGVRVEIERLSMVGNVFADPLTLSDFRGRVQVRDRRASIRADALRLPATEGGGLATVDWSSDDGMTVSVDVSAPTLSLSDLLWLDPRLPDGAGGAQIGFESGPTGRGFRWSGAHLHLGLGVIAGDGEVRFSADGRLVTTEDVELSFERFDLAHVEPFVARPLPVDGLLDGDVRLSGPLDNLVTEGSLTLTRSTGVTASEFDGALRLLQPYGARDLTARFSTLDYSALEGLIPGIPLTGAGPVRIDGDGRLDTGINFSLDAGHRGAGEKESTVRARGTVTEVDGQMVVDLQADLEPLDLSSVVRLPQGLAPLGEVAGRVTATGPVSDLSVTAELGTQSGVVIVDSRFDASDPLAEYELSVSATRYALSAVIPDLPDTTTVSGTLVISGRTDEAGTARAEGEVRLRSSKIGPLRVDSAAATLSLSGGLVSVDTVWALVAGLYVGGTGTLAVVEDGDPGNLSLEFDAESLSGLQGLFFGENVIARDSLSTLERESLLIDGVDLDTLPLSEEIRVGGGLVGRMTLEGGLYGFSANGSASLDHGVLGRHSVGAADITFDATGLPSRQPRVEVDIEADSLRIMERAFAGGTARLEYRDPRGTLNIFLARDETEDYLARIAFEADSVQRILHIDEMGLRFADERWNLGGPATVSWDPDGLTFRDLRIIRPGPGGLRFRADGRYPFDGPASLDLDVERLDLARLDHLLQLPDTLEGLVSLDMAVVGTADQPEITASFQADDFRYQDIAFGALQGTLDYRERSLTGEVVVVEGGRRVLELTGRAPARLVLDTLGFGIPDEAIDLQVVADTLPLAMLFALTEGFSNVTGSVNGEVRLGGTAHHLAPSGTLQVEGAGATIDGLAVHQRDISATLVLSEDGSVQVDGTSRANGTARVTGTVTLDPATDPGFDLMLELDGFKGVDRRDVTGLVSGEVRLGGSYRSPVLTGELRVDEGTLFVEEFQRATIVVDLDDDAFLDPVDPTLVALRPLLGGANPFLHNIRMEDLTLAVTRDTWIRSEVMNVELGGELQVLYDRQAQDLAMVGSLEAVRGSYEALGRPFQVTGGSIQFVGTSGINPNLDIQADNRIRTADGNRFTITAGLTGTLLTPQVSFSSDQAGVGQADLLSYLVFGRPSYAIASGQSAQVRGAASALLGSGLTLGLNTFSNRLGSELARGLGLGVDYLSISQQDLALGGEGTGGTLGTTVVETGWYLAPDLFVVLLLRPLAGSRTGSPLAGARFEWAASDSYSIEAFFEDSFFRNRVIGFGELGLQSSTALGLSLFREWGY